MSTEPTFQQATAQWDANRKANNKLIDAIFAELRRKRDPMYATECAPLALAA